MLGDTLDPRPGDCSKAFGRALIGEDSDFNELAVLYGAVPKAGDAGQECVLW